MTTDTTSSRRSFLKSGAFIAMPLISVPTAALADEGAAMRLAQLEDEAAVRTVHERWLRDNAGGVTHLDGASAVTPDHGGDPLAIEIAGDGRSAIARQPCIVETASVLEADCTFAQMALAQGNSCMRNIERRVLITNLAKSDDGWVVTKAQLAQA
ncbi:MULTISPECIES: hypothetical protein [unclassified Sphingobium]|uniref:hypothetical protein n=1 Tax=unclassified Sphingobium TaxID=2611147 RepID=UPI0022253217|nr:MULTISPECIES: hypothetical protein [unclassified Sphingobium]MCW2413067.1 hypothetical protein [Sphingobium sp. B8D3D]MCW2414635.1 hypothetical protein [Sphingobium sp. B8D3A]